MWWFKKKEPPREISPLERLENAVDEVNAAVAALPKEAGRIRPWVRTGNRTAGTAPKLMLGYWDSGTDSFIVTYEGK